jgi:hypothetical protein
VKNTQLQNDDTRMWRVGNEVVAYFKELGAGVPQSVQCLTTDRTTEVHLRQRQRIFPLASVSRPDLRPPNLLSDGYRWSFPGGKARRGRDADFHLMSRSCISSS